MASSFETALSRLLRRRSQDLMVSASWRVSNHEGSGNGSNELKNAQRNVPPVFLFTSATIFAATASIS